MRLAALVGLITLVIGTYDGFYGPGSGTFLILAFSWIARMDVRSANGLSKAANLATCLTSLAVYLHDGQVVILLGLAGAVCNTIGSWIGSGMAIRSGTRITRPIILFVLALLFLRMLGVF